LKELKTFLQEDGSYRYTVRAPDFVVDREERPNYEKDRFASMEANLRPGDLLFDVGAELGWQSAIFARFVGPKYMALFEPHEKLWPVIREIWALNCYDDPWATYCGFVGDRGAAVPESSPWPLSSLFMGMTNFNQWDSIHRDASGSVTSLDAFVEATGANVKALTIDVEGAEYKVLRGAFHLLRRQRPLAWVSVHPKERLAAFGATRPQIFDLMRSLNYEWQYLGVDHEMHYFFFPAERRSSVALVAPPYLTNGKRDVTFEEAMPDWTDDRGMPYTAAWCR
jgi:FkbM family methyltransferase